MHFILKLQKSLYPAFKAISHENIAGVCRVFALLWVLASSTGFYYQPTDLLPCLHTFSLQLSRVCSPFYQLTAVVQAVVEWRRKQIFRGQVLWDGIDLSLVSDVVEKNIDSSSKSNPWRRRRENYDASKWWRRRRRRKKWRKSTNFQQKLLRFTYCNDWTTYRSFTKYL